YITNINTEDIISIFQINASGAVVKTYFRSDETITVAANVATIAGATFGATDTFVVFTSIERQNDVVDITGIYNATEPSLSDGDKAQLQLDSKGKLYVNSGASGVSGGGLSLYVLNSGNTLNQGKIEYTSASTCTLSALSFTASADLISKLDRIDNTGKLVATYTLADTAMSLSSNVLTVTGMTASSTDTFVLYILGSERTNDTSTNSQLTSNLNPVWSRYTDAETLVTAQDLTASYADFGAEIDMTGYTHLRVAIVTDVNDSENVTLKLLGKNSLGGSDEYEIEGGTTQALWTTSASDSKISYTFDVKGTPVIQLQAIAGTLGATAGDLTISISKIWRGN
ncbi:MAG: hypothetical protein PHN69_08235, partial [Candidatus Pacebacteria bacterium]|nr:hypothetical protein [Candidatus Paceibacterota bacterium]